MVFEKITTLIFIMFKNNPKKFGVFTNVGQIMSFKPNINIHISKLCMKIYPSFIIFLLISPTHIWWTFLKCDNHTIIMFIWTLHPNIHIHIHSLELKEVQM